MNRDCFWLTEDQFSRLAPLLPSDTRGMDATVGVAVSRCNKRRAMLPKGAVPQAAA